MKLSNLRAKNKVKSAAARLALEAVVVAALVLAIIGVLKGQISFAIGIIPIVTSIIAIIFSAYTLVQQKYAYETSSWNTSLMRLGQLFDQAVLNDDLSLLICEPVDREGSAALRKLHLSPKQDMWLANLFMACEQIYIATSGASQETRRAWKRFLSNQLNKPTIRAAFLRDTACFSDYHQDFIEFACGRNLSKSGEPQYSGGVIAKRVVNAAMQTKPQMSGEVALQNALRSRPVLKGDMRFWREMYSDPEVKRQMYAVPTENDDALLGYLNEGDLRAGYTVIMDEKPVGGFSITKETATKGTFGIVIHRDFRGMGLGNSIMKMLEARAKEMGILTLRGDVYSDNAPSIRLLEKSGFRPFIWYEKNLN